MIALVTETGIPARTVSDHAALARHLRNHFEQWFAPVFDPLIEPTK
ncbi:hypothetical protein R5W24_004917 [Gemmata sp. JC717]|nr:hypothetical protein [Gemmata algarum]MDY3555771.1 hypothetical protein [Gemmata algarum]